MTATLAAYLGLAQLIEYPTPNLPEQVRACAAVLRSGGSRAAKHVESFADFVDSTPPGTLEEIYTHTFDLKPVCYPYVGFQLFGDNYKRGEFLVLLKDHYRAAGFEPEGELPDHLAVILRYLAMTEDGALITEGVIPALDRMLPALKDNPYQDVLRAILVTVRGK